MITSNYNEQINQQLEKSERKNSSIFTASRNSMKSGVGVDHLQHLLPSDDRIFAEVKKMLTGADLMTITKKQVRDELSIIFETDLSVKKKEINDMIEDILSGRV